MTDAWGTDDAGAAVECLEAGLWLLLRGRSADGSFANTMQTLKALVALGTGLNRVCVCSGACEAHELVNFGLDWVVRQAMAAGVEPIAAWSMGSLHPATRYAMDGEIGGLGHSRRADLVLLNDDLEVQNTWYGGQLVVEDKKITPNLDRALSKRYEYPQVAYKSVRFPRHLSLAPALPVAPATANVMGVGHGYALEHRRIALDLVRNWGELLVQHELCFVALIERHGETGAVVHGLLQGFGLVPDGAVATSVAHDAHNVVVVGRSEAEMKLAVATIKESKGGVCAVRGGRVLACVALPIAGLMSELRAPDVSRQTEVLKLAWAELNCRLPFLSFSQMSNCAFPEIRLTARGLVLAPEMRVVPLFEDNTAATTLS
jgi:adenine deaminase